MVCFGGILKPVWINYKEGLQLMQSMQMQALSGKELEYIADSISNEDLLLKQCAATAATTQNEQVRQVCLQHIQNHTQHMDTLTQLIQQHQQYAPTSPQ